MAARQAWRRHSGPLPAHVDLEITAQGALPSAAIDHRLLIWRIPKDYLEARPSAAQLEGDLAKALGGLPPWQTPEDVVVTSGDFPGRGKALFFRSLLNSSDKELKSEPMYQGIFYIVSALKRAGVSFVLAEGRMSLAEGEIVTKAEELQRILQDNPDINFIGLTLFDAYFEKAKELIAFLRANTRAFIAVGGYMPTDHPYETMAHLPEAHFFVRGAGEQIVPRLMSIIGGADSRSGLSMEQLEALRDLDGLLFGQQDALLLAGSENMLRVDPNESHLDFSILDERQVTTGTNLFISRGCPYHCLFCTSKDKGRFVGKSPARSARLLADYGKRLREIYGSFSAVPPLAFGVGFYDDDFLSDPDWAAATFRLIKNSPFHVRFFQASISSFFRREDGRITRELDRELLDELPLELFTPKRGGRDDEHPHVYIGTENYCDEELKRLGKSHRYDMIETLVRELSRRGIRQAHHFIVSNAETTLKNLLENLTKIARLEEEFAPAYSVLKPPIAHLVSFYASPNYKLMKHKGLLSQVELRGLLSVEGFPEFDYPLVRRDLPVDPRVRELAELMPRFCQGSWQQALEGVCGHLDAKLGPVAEVGPNLWR